jgi:phage-related protein
MLRLDVLVAGSARTVYALVINERNEVMEYLNQLPRVPRKKVIAIMHRLVAGQSGGGFENFRRLSESVYEFKEHMTNTRLFCFWHKGAVVVCTHAHKKPGKRQLQMEIDKVKALQQRCISEGVVNA